MAEESIDNHLTSQKIGPEDGGEKTNPNRSLGIKKFGNQTPSRYLSGPTGSCHDLCKYGIKHAVEPKPWSSTLKRDARKGRKTDVSKETMVYLVEKKKSTDSPKPSPTTKIGKPKNPVVVKEVASSLLNEEIVSSGKKLSPFEETDVPMEHTSREPVQAQSIQSSLPVHSEKELSPFEETDIDKKHANSDQKHAQTERSSLPLQSEKNLFPFEETNVPTEYTSTAPKQAQPEQSSSLVQELSKNTKREIVNSKSPSGSSSRAKSARRDQQMRTSSIGSKKVSVPQGKSLSSKYYVKKSSTVSAKTSKNLKEMSHLKNQKNVKEVKPEPANNGNLLEKNFHFIETTPENESLEATLASDSAMSPAVAALSVDKSSKEVDKQIGKSGSPASSRKSFRHARNAIRRAMPVLSSLVPFGSKGKRDMQHNMHSSSPSSPSTIPPSSPFHGKQNGGTSNYAKIRHGYQAETAMVANRTAPKRSTKFGSGNKLVPTRKLSFRRGKVIELQPQRNNMPRRLKFRPVRHLSDIQRGTKDMGDTNVNLDRIIKREKDDNESNDAKLKSENFLARSQLVEANKRRNLRKKANDGSQLNGSKSGSEQVVLRHQNTEWKKVYRRLYNNVIEETASKLAEQRKSKVKALVGAFETVISLDSHQESPVAISTG